jgi:uncharacterized membrane protein YebE (DUF533 family)
MNLDKVMSNLAGSGVLGGLAGGAVSGALISNKKARKTAGTALKIGGLAALGGMAWKAYQGYQAEQGKAQPASTDAAPGRLQADPVWGGLEEKGFALDGADDRQGSRALLLIQAMIAAACADGHMDNDERERIMARVADAELAADEKAMVFDALHQPLSLSELSQRVDCPELAAEVYMASLLAVDETRIEAELYLDALAYRLGVPSALAAQMRNQLPLQARAVA